MYRRESTTKSNEANAEEFDWALGLNRMSLRLMGVWPEEEERVKRARGNLYRATTTWRVPLMVGWMFVFIFLPQMYALRLNGHDLRLILDNFMTSCPAFTSCLKLLCLWYNKDVVKSMCNDWLQPADLASRRIMRRSAALAKAFTLGGYVFIGGSYVGFVVVPLFGLNIRLVSNATDYGKRRLLVQSYYPYDYSTSPNFELTHISQLIAGVIIAMSLAVPDNYLGALIFHLSGQFNILAKQIRTFIGENSSAAEVTGKDFDRNFGRFVDRHAHLRRMVAAVEQSFTLLILAQLFCMCVMACCLGFRILYTIQYKDEEASIIQLINLTSALVALMLFTLGDCSASEALNSYSLGLFSYVYQSTWYVMPHRNARMLILMMLMSKKQQPLTAGKILILSMSSYTSILKSIAGYLSVLIAVNS